MPELTRVGEITAWARDFVATENPPSILTLGTCLIVPISALLRLDLASLGMTAGTAHRPRSDPHPYRSDRTRDR